MVSVKRRCGIEEIRNIYITTPQLELQRDPSTNIIYTGGLGRIFAGFKKIHVYINSFQGKMGSNVRNYLQ